ncbi:hypothetical protein ACQCLI_12820 [Pseudomonas nitroreducens]|uniref:hypothetical protein n=1 Tax=Pseudomonas nitroreducens TaxID=46680 RepID=UPI00030D8065|nr:hypothetical protein [Pseudomonas nitroreducens]
MPRAFYKYVLLAAIVLFSPIAATKPAAVPDKNSQLQAQKDLHEQIRNAELEVQHLKEQLSYVTTKVTINEAIANNQLSMQDKRLADLGLQTAQQANYMGSISNLSTLVGLGITVLTILVAFVTYISVKNKATSEAKEAAEHWFRDHGEILTVRIQTLHEEASNLRSEVEKLKDVSQEAIREIHQRRDEFFKAADEILLTTRPPVPANVAEHRTDSPSKHKHQKTPPQTDSSSDKNIDKVRKISEELEFKPESTFTSDEHFARGLSLLSQDSFNPALINLRKAINLETHSASPNEENLVKMMFALALCYSNLKRNKSEISIYNEILERFRDSPNSNIIEYLLMSSINKSIRLSEQDRVPEAIELIDTTIAKYESSSDTKIAKYIPTLYGAKASILSNNNDLGEALTICDNFERNFKIDEYENSNLEFSRIKNTRAYCHILLSKKNWSDTATRINHLELAIKTLIQAIADNDYRPVVLGNLGYAYHLLGDTERAVSFTTECLKLGGKETYELQKEDALKYRLAPQDPSYEALLKTTWESLSGEAE